jgi:hypothetical protein
VKSFKLVRPDRQELNASGRPIRIWLYDGDGYDTELTIRIEGGKFLLYMDASGTGPYESQRLVSGPFTSLRGVLVDTLIRYRSGHLNYRP